MGSLAKAAAKSAGERHAGFAKLVENARKEVFWTNIVGVVSNIEHGGVRRRADSLGIPFIYMPAPWTAQHYLTIVRSTGAEFFLCSGWLKMVYGLDPRQVINIHPGPLPLTAGLHGEQVHAAALASYHRGEITHTQICMHFVTTGAGAKYDEGPVFFRLNIEIRPDDTVATLSARVNMFEHVWQWQITDLVTHGAISWDGVDPASLRVPANYIVERTERII